MKHEIEATKPEQLVEYWPGQYEIFSHFEYLSGVPHALFLITTLKENGRVNACFHSWSGFSGDSGGFFAVMPGLMRHTHTYKNILRGGEFVINFLSAAHYDACQKTIRHNDEEADELIAAGLTAEPSACVRPPRIAEAFLSMECKLHSETDLSGKGISGMIIGLVVRAAIDPKHSEIDAICSEGGFMYYVHAPKDIVTGEGERGAIARLEVTRDE